MSWKIVAIVSLLINFIVLVAAYLYIRSPLQELNDLRGNVTDVCQIYEDAESSPIIGGIVSQLNLDEDLKSICDQ